MILITLPGVPADKRCALRTFGRAVGEAASQRDPGKNRDVAEDPKVFQDLHAGLTAQVEIYSSLSFSLRS